MIQIKKTNFSLGSLLIEAFYNPIIVIFTIIICSVIVALLLYYFPEIIIRHRRAVKRFTQFIKEQKRAFGQITIKEKRLYYFYEGLTLITIIFCFIGAFLLLHFIGAFLLLQYNYLIVLVLVVCILTIAYLWTRWETHLYKILKERLLSKKEG